MRWSQRRLALSVPLSQLTSLVRRGSALVVRSYECIFDILRYPVTVIIGKMTFEFRIRAGASLLVGVALLIAACSRPSPPADSPALKPIDQAALQNMVDTTAKELLVPGAVLLLRAPQGEFKVTMAPRNWARRVRPTPTPTFGSLRTRSR